MAKSEVARAESPLPETIREARLRYGLSIAEAAGLVHAASQSWRQWETPQGKPGHRPMHAAFWELFILKASARFKPEGVVKGPDGPLDSV